MIKFVVTLSIFLNIVLGVTVFTLQSDQFIAIVDAARNVNDSQQEVKQAIAKFYSAAAKIEKFTTKIDTNVVEMDQSMKSVLSKIGRIEEVLILEWNH